MSEQEFLHHRRVFDEFTHGYLAAHRGRCDDLLQLKVDHSLRVLQEAEGIIAAEHIAPRQARLCRLAALFHDTGRFPQLDRYGTFRDAQSVNHARLGVQTIKRESLLDGLADDDRKVVLTAIVLHNVRLLPQNLPPDADRAARVVRDADKLDIVPVILDSLDAEGHSNKVVTLNTKSDPLRFSEHMAEQLAQKCLADYSRMVYANDFRLLLLSWVYDLNHAHSARMFMERGYIDALAAGLPHDDELKTVVAAVKKDTLTMANGNSLAKKTPSS